MDCWVERANIAEVLIENIRNKEDIENIDKEKENEEKVCRWEEKDREEDKEDTN